MFNWKIERNRMCEWLSLRISYYWMLSALSSSLVTNSVRMTACEVIHKPEMRKKICNTLFGELIRLSIRIRSIFIRTLQPWIDSQISLIKYEMSYMFRQLIILLHTIYLYTNESMKRKQNNEIEPNPTK